MINLELTSDCNMQCRHCYNFWRDETHPAHHSISIENMDRLFDMLCDSGVFHVVLTGGEPFLAFDIMEYALQRLHRKGISTSVNSNLTLATPEKLNRLQRAGLDHILTSLNSYIPKVNDAMVNKRGAYNKIIGNIKAAIASGIRISANMIISKSNIDHVFDTAMLCSELGVQKIFATRMVPPLNACHTLTDEWHSDHSELLKMLDELLRAKKRTGIGIGSLISYPLCFLGDLEKYSDFVGRGCPAQRGNRMVINSDGTVHACTHEVISYGNVFEDGIQKCFAKMSKWHAGSYHFEGCRGCEYIEVCGSGCRSAAYCGSGKYDAADPLFKGKENISKPYSLKMTWNEDDEIGPDMMLCVPDSIRFRKETDFFVVNIRWADAINLDLETSEYLMLLQLKKEILSFQAINEVLSKNVINGLIYKEILVPADPVLQMKMSPKTKTGCSIDPGFLFNL